jgi:hypothetical protein
MKKVASAITMFLLITGLYSIQAQNFRLGLTGSPSISWYKSETDGYNSEGVRFGISYGLISEFVLAEQYTFATGINVTYFGGKLDYPIAESPTVEDPFVRKERTYRLQNVEVPFTLKMKTREIGYNTYFAKFGFGGGVNIRAKADDSFYNPTGSNSSTEKDIDIKSETPLFRASMIVGVGFEHSLGGSTALIGGVTFNNGFTNILKGKDYANIRNQQARANYLELSLGIIF